MKCLIERVNDATLRSAEKTIQINKGMLIYVGFTALDDEVIASQMVDKCLSERLFSDASGKLNRSVKDIQGDVLIVPAFTLYADLTKGHRPSFSQALAFDDAEILYLSFIALCQNQYPASYGVFGSDMAITATNDGPITLILERTGL